MPKIRTCRAAAKRFSATGTGKIKYRKANANHILTKKTTKRKRSLRRGPIVDITNERQIHRMMPYL